MKKSVSVLVLMFAISLVAVSCGGSKGASDPKELFEKFKEFSVESLKGDANIEDIVQIIHFASADNKSKYLAAAKLAQKYAEETAEIGKDFAAKANIEQFNPYENASSDMFTPVFKDVKLDGDKGTIVFVMNTGFSKVEDALPIVNIDGLWFISDEYKSIKSKINEDLVKMEKEHKEQLESLKKQMQETLKDPKELEAVRKQAEEMKDRMKNNNMPAMPDFGNRDDDDADDANEHADDDDDEHIPTMPGVDADAYKKYAAAMTNYSAVAAKWQNDMDNPQAIKEMKEAQIALTEAAKALQPK